MDLVTIKKKFVDISNRLPNFIGEGEADMIIYNRISIIFSNILSLVSDKKFTKSVINKAVTNCDQMLDDIFFLLIDELSRYEMIIQYIEEFIEELIIDLIEVEQYNSCCNIRDFDKVFIKNEREIK
jgi:hypothetical protein